MQRIDQNGAAERNVGRSLRIASCMSHIVLSAFGVTARPLTAHR
jgi:hypothetical protein